MHLCDKWGHFSNNWMYSIVYERCKGLCFSSFCMHSTFDTPSVNSWLFSKYFKINDLGRLKAKCIGVLPCASMEWSNLFNLSRFKYFDKQCSIWTPSRSIIKLSGVNPKAFFLSSIWLASISSLNISIISGLISWRRHMWWRIVFLFLSVSVLLQTPCRLEQLFHCLDASTSADNVY